MIKVTRKSDGGKRDIKHIEELAESQLRRSAIRVTRARVKVLTALLDARRAFSHQDVQETLADMDRVTLYRALDCLTDAGLAHKIAGDDRVFRYSAGNDHAQPGTVSDHQHGHFKCTRCARVFCLAGHDGVPRAADLARKRQPALHEELQNVLLQALGKGFQSHDIALTIKGWCADCAH